MKLMTIFVLILGVMVGALGLWYMSRNSAYAGSAISRDDCLAFANDEFLTLDYSFDIQTDGENDPFVMVQASVFDDANTTSRYMGHAGSVHRGGVRFGQIQERLHILNNLGNPYVVVVVTIGNSGGEDFERRAFVVPIQYGKQGDSSDAFSAADL